MFYAFANGAAWATPLTDASGAAIANPTPVHFGILQDISVEMSRDAKPLYGTRRHAIDMGGGKEKITVKVKYAQLNAALLSIYTGQAVTTAQDGIVRDLTGSAIPATPYQVTPTVPNTGTWSQDLGVRDANGIQYARVASSPATGQYSVSAGVYTFAAADTGKVVFIPWITSPAKINGILWGLCSIATFCSSRPATVPMPLNRPTISPRAIRALSASMLCATSPGLTAGPSVRAGSE